MAAVFFRSRAAFRAWLVQHHHDTTEISVGFHRKDSGRGGITYPEALDEALCFGWIDGVRRTHDTSSYTIRFTPRRRDSTWSLANLRHAARLQREGRMTPAGLAALAARHHSRPAVYSFEQRREARFDPASARAFRTNEAAWTFFQNQPPWYRRTATWWVISAKRPDTRARRLRTLIKCSASGDSVPPLARPRKR